jgi:hypothetical protein
MDYKLGVYDEINGMATKSAGETDGCVRNLVRRLKEERDRLAVTDRAYSSLTNYCRSVGMREGQTVTEFVADLVAGVNDLVKHCNSLGMFEEQTLFEFVSALAEQVRVANNRENEIDSLVPGDGNLIDRIAALVLFSSSTGLWHADRARH